MWTLLRCTMAAGIFFFCDIVSKPWLGGYQMDSVWDDLLSSCLTEVETTVLTASPLEGIRALSCLCLLSSLFSPGSPTAFTTAYGERQCWLTTETLYPPVCSCPMAQRWVILFLLTVFHNKSSHSIVWGAFRSQQLPAIDWQLWIVLCLQPKIHVQI